MSIAKAASVVTAIGTIGGGAIYLDHAHAPRSDLDAMRAEGKVQNILSLVEQAHHEGAAPWLCRAIEAEIIALCTDNPDHYICTDPETKTELKRKAGCG